MATKTIIWNDGTTATLTYTGQGNGTIVVTSDPNNNYEARSAQVTVKTTDGSNIRRTITIVQAAKARIDISSAIVTAANQTYSGSALTPTPTVTLNGTIVPSSGYNVAYSNNTNAGTATITITGKNDYTGTATGTFIIAKANPVYVAPTANNRTYDATSKALLIAGSNTTPGTFTYSSSSSGTYSTTIPSQTNAGSYTTYWKFTPSDTSNYNTIGPNSISTSIAQVTVTLNWGDLVWTYDKTAHSTTCTASGLKGSDTCTVTLTGNSITNKGTATVTASSLSNGNYKLPSTKTATLTVNARTVTLNWGTVTWTYDGSAHSTTCTAGNVCSGDTCTVTLTGNSITNAGTATVAASGLSNSNYVLPSSKTNTLTVNAKVVTLNWGTTSWTYDKASHSTTCIASGLVGSDTCTVALTGNSVGPNVGSATVTASSLSNSNYTLPSTKTKAISIVAKTVSLHWGTLSWVYDAAAHSTTCTAGNLVSGDSCTVTLTGNSITTKGITTVTASSLSNGNYTLPSSKTNTLTISARPINITASSASKTYDGTALTFNSATAEATGTNRGLVSGHSMTSCTVTGTITNAGSANNVPSAAVIKSGSTDVTSNYSITYVNGTLTVSQATGTATVSGRTVTYSRGAQNMVSVSGNTGTMHYRVGTNGSWTTTIPTRTNAGSDTIYWYMDASTNYTGKGSSSSPAGSVTGTVNKATPVLSVSPTKTSDWTYDGQYHALASGGAMKHSSSDSTVVEGDFGYSAVKDAGLYTAAWQFDPVDTLNYNSTYGNVGTVTVAKASRALSFTDSYVVLNTSSDVTKTATPSAGSDDGAITYSISSTTYATINSSSGKVTSKTSDGSAIVTATIAEGTNYLSASASYALYVFATIHNYSYSGSYSAVTLPPGTYQFQCWGAQGGSNAAESTYGIIAKEGGKGGYSVGQLTISQATAVRVYVGGQGGNTTAGFNGGGSSSGRTTYNSGGTLGVCTMGAGGGATDIRLSDGNLLSRMIVAGGGSGGAMAYKAVTSTVPRSETINSLPSANWWINANNQWEKDAPTRYYGTVISCSSYRGATFTLSISNNTKVAFLTAAPNSSTPNYSTPNWASGWSSVQWANSTSYFTVPSNANYVYIELCVSGTQRGVTSCTFAWSETVVNTETKGQVGFAGGGINGVVYSSAYNVYAGKQNEAGYGADFGIGRNITVVSQRYSAGAGGGGWYGGGCQNGNDSDITVVLNSGGGSGFVNTYANRGYRPSGYTGLQLDSGTTYAGNTSFVAPGGGNETGHTGNGYARITRLS